jgi:hypothetical protein
MNLAADLALGLDPLLAPDAASRRAVCVEVDPAGAPLVLDAVPLAALAHGAARERALWRVGVARAFMVLPANGREASPAPDAGFAAAMRAALARRGVPTTASETRAMLATAWGGSGEPWP